MARVTALVAILGIAFGVAVLIVALALANGFRDEMRDKILRGTAHISLMRRDGEAISDLQRITAQVREVEGVREAIATTYDGALLSGKSGPAYAVLRGIDSNSEFSKIELRRTIIDGSIEPLFIDEVVATDKIDTTIPGGPLEPDLESYKQVPSDASLPHAVIGAELAARAGLNVGDVAQIISGDAQLTPLGLAPRYRRLRIAGIFRLGLFEYDATWIYVSLPVASSIMGAPQGSASVISIDCPQ